MVLFHPLSRERFAAFVRDGRVVKAAGPLVPGAATDAATLDALLAIANSLPDVVDMATMLVPEHWHGHSLTLDLAGAMEAWAATLDDAMSARVRHLAKEMRYCGEQEPS